MNRPCSASADPPSRKRSALLVRRPPHPPSARSTPPRLTPPPPPPPPLTPPPSPSVPEAWGQWRCHKRHIQVACGGAGPEWRTRRKVARVEDIRDGPAAWPPPPPPRGDGIALVRYRVRHNVAPDGPNSEGPGRAELPRLPGSARWRCAGWRASGGGWSPSWPRSGSRPGCRRPGGRPDGHVAVGGGPDRGGRCRRARIHPGTVRRGGRQPPELAAASGRAGRSLAGGDREGEADRVGLPLGPISFRRRPAAAAPVRPGHTR